MSIRSIEKSIDVKDTIYPSINKFQDLFQRLSAPFPPEVVKSRMIYVKGKSKKLHYIDERDAMHRLNEVIGPFNWERTFSFHNRTTLEGNQDDGYKEVSSNVTVCRITITLPDGSKLTKEGVAGDTSIESEKGSASDAFKRAAVAFGVGMYLYEGRDPVEVYSEYNDTAKPKEELVDDDLPVNMQSEKDRLISMINKIDNIGDLDSFKEKNRPGIKALPKDDYKSVVSVFSAKKIALTNQEIIN